MFHRAQIMTGMAMLGLVFAGGRAIAQHSHGGGHQMMGYGDEESKTGHSRRMAMVHGGQVTMTPHHHFEVLFTDKQARVYVYDAEQEPINDPKEVKADMTLMTKGGESETMHLQYVGPDPENGRTQGYFHADHEMASIEDGEMKGMFRMMGLEKDSIEFRTPVTMGRLMSYACPMKDSPPAEDPGRCPRCGMQMTTVQHGEHMSKAMDKDSDHGHGKTAKDHQH